MGAVSTATAKPKLKQFLDNIYPVGDIYVQFPSAAATGNDKTLAFPTANTPASKFGGTWEQIWNTEGIFFRTEGDPYTDTNGENNVRTDGKQTMTLQGHEHGIRMGSGAQSDASMASTAATIYAVQENVITTIITDATYGTLLKGKETRPINRLFRLWKRTA